jgi:hypothetical protein
VHQIAAEKFKEAYAYIHGIRIAMPKDESAEKISHSIRTLTELETLFKSIITRGARKLNCLRRK